MFVKHAGLIKSLVCMVLAVILHKTLSSQSAELLIPFLLVTIYAFIGVFTKAKSFRMDITSGDVGEAAN